MKNSKKVFSFVAFIVAIAALYAFCECGDANVTRIDEPVDSTTVDSVKVDSLVSDSLVKDTVVVDSVK